MNEAKARIQTEAFNALKKNNYKGFIEVGTGLGKSKILVDCIKALNPTSVLYLCDSTINRDVTFKDELRKWGAENWIDRMDFECYQTAYKWEGKHYDLVVGDEADFALTPEYSKVFFKNEFDHVILCSGSLEADKKPLLKQIVPIVYKCTIKEMEESGAVNKANYYVVNYKLLPHENKEYLNFNERFAKMLNAPHPNVFMVNQLKIKRKQFLSTLSSSFEVANKLVKEIQRDNPNEKILIFAGLTEQADKFKYSFHSKNAKNNNIELFNNGSIMECAVVGKIDRGVNLEGVRHLVYESVPSSGTKMVQKSGRGRRLDADEWNNNYFLIPYYTTIRGELKPTIVDKWMTSHYEKINITNVSTYKFSS